jgi:hypothetical protein
MTNEPKLAPETPAKDAANQSGKAAEATPTVAPAPEPKTAPPAEAKKI